MSFANAAQHKRASMIAAPGRRIGEGDGFRRGYFTKLRQRGFPARHSAGRVCRIISSQLDLRNQLAALGIAAARISFQFAGGAGPAINTR